MGGWLGVMMRNADVNCVAWQQICVSSWQGFTVTGGHTYSSVYSVCVSLCLSIRQQVSLEGKIDL